MKSSTAVPPPYWPWTSMPGETLRATTSPSISARSAYVCVTPSPAPARKRRAFCFARSTSAFALR